MRYIPGSANGKPRLIIHFGNDSPTQAQEIMGLLAEYVKVQTGTEQKVISMGEGLYYIGNAGAVLSKVNYRILYDDSDKSELVRARMDILTDSACTIELKTLETFVKDVVLQ